MSSITSFKSNGIIMHTSDPRIVYKKAKSKRGYGYKTLMLIKDNWMVKKGMEITAEQKEKETRGIPVCNAHWLGVEKNE